MVLNGFKIDLTKVFLLSQVTETCPTIINKADPHFYKTNKTY
jgi:hypothetical protein